MPSPRSRTRDHRTQSAKGQPVGSRYVSDISAGDPKQLKNIFPTATATGSARDLQSTNVKNYYFCESLQKEGGREQLTNHKVIGFDANSQYKREDAMARHTKIPRVSASRREFFTRVGAAALVGSAASLPVSREAHATRGHGSGTFSNKSAPKPIPFLVDTGAPNPFDFIHWTLPGPPGATTQILELGAMGLDVDPSVMTDYEGFTTYAVLAGKARGGDGEEFDCELDIRVMDGVYVGEDFKRHRGTFGFF